MTIRYDGKVAIVTGAGGGLGRSHALQFAARGAKVVVNDLGGSVDGSGGSSAMAEAVVAEIKAAGGEAIANGSSVCDPGGVERLVKDAMDAWGRIDILVNNAGVLRDKSFHNMSLQDLDFVIDVHLKGAAYCSRAVWPIMRDQGYGRIVMTTSTSGMYGNFGQANYGAGKMGQLGLMQVLKIEGAKYNVHVNAVAPVAVTRMTEAFFTPEMSARMQPEWVTPAVLYLASDEAPNGEILMAGGGLYSRTRWVESDGVAFASVPSVDDIAARIDDIRGAEPHHHYTQGGEQVAHVATRGAKA